MYLCAVIITTVNTTTRNCIYTAYTMIRFLGNIEANTDAKGRVFLPASFRKVLQTAGEEQLVLRKDLYAPCLVLYPQSVWDELTDKLWSRVNLFDDKSRRLYRLFVGEALKANLDSSGRLLLPSHLMEKVGITKNVSFLGVNNKIEIWDTEKLAQTLQPSDDFSSELKALMA